MTNPEEFPMSHPETAGSTAPATRRLTVGMSPRIAARYPQCRTVFLLVQGIKNGEAWPETEEALAGLEADVRQGLRHIPDENESAISVWHELLRSFGTNPRRARPSIDALGRRLRKSGRLPRVSPLVDTCNLVSLTYMLPTGGFDLSAFHTGFELRFAQPDDVYVPLGEPDKTETPLEGEVVYADGRQVMTRHWNHRDSDVTKVTARTRDAVLLLEGIAPAVSAETLLRARRELADRVAPHAESVTVHEIDPAAPSEIAWEPTS
ncbi:phenylalanine--tRNA ligase beta subunit-related protein [Streptomyces sp. NPDC002785]|uniref:B3/B4 domain-containing protein n=1 Tax=Streptomyces sp. NPDC002785 TaxID=3154543 RepID=UPI0033282E5F